MTISSYADLQTSVATWLHASSLTSIIPDLILLGEKRINREVRTADMETSYTGAISSGVIAVPTDFLSWKAVYVNSTPVSILRVKPLDWLLENYPTRTSDRQPLFMSRNGSNFDFGPYPDSAYTIKGTYYKRMAAVSSSWHALATAQPDLYLMAALCEAAPYLVNDVRIGIWEGKYAAIRDALNDEAKGAEISGGAIRMTAG